MTKFFPYPEPIRPRRRLRLPQMNKANKIMRRFYSGHTIPPAVIARPVVAVSAAPTAESIFANQLGPLLAKPERRALPISVLWRAGG